MGDLVIPKGCFLRPFLEESMVCGNTKTEAKCGGKCEWKSETSCDGEKVKKTNKCDSNGDSVMASLLGDAGVAQNDKCRAVGKTKDACESVPEVPAAKIDDFAASTLVFTITNVFVTLLAL